MADEETTIETFRDWTGSLISVSRAAIPNIRKADDKFALNNILPCIVTSLKSDRGIARGYSSLVSELEIIFGNIMWQTPALELTIEFITMVDATEFIARCAGSNMPQQRGIMASLSIISGSRVSIYCPPWCIDEAIISEASINLLPGTQMAQATIRIEAFELSNISGDYTYDSEAKEGDNTTKLRLTRNEPEYITENAYMYGGCYFSKSEWNGNPENERYNKYMIMTSMDLTFRENIKIIGAGKEVTAYPRYPTSVNIGLVAPNMPHSFIWPADIYEDIKPEDILPEVEKMVREIIGARSWFSVENSYGIINIFPVAAQMIASGSAQSQIMVSGYLQSFIPAPKPDKPYEIQKIIG